MYYLTIRNDAGDIWLYVYRNNKFLTRFPLNKRGCIAAGKYVYSKKPVSVMCSSTIDHPKEFNVWFRHDIRSLLLEGANQCQTN